MKRFVLAVLMTGVMVSPVLAQDVTDRGRTAPGVSPDTRWASFGAAPQAATPAPKKWTVLTGADFPTLYFFRGIRQETDADFTMQPYVDLGIAAAPNVALNFGLWNSIQSGSSGSGCDCGRNAYYELDFYASATFTSGKWKPGVLFTSYTSPNDAFTTVNELAAVVAYDDSSSKVPLSPKVILAFELSDGQADAGSGKGTYLEAGIRPSFKPGGKPVTIAVPVKFGFSLHNYYESPVTGEDSGFGYFDIGVNASVPIAKFTKGAWEIHGGVDIYTFGQTLKEFNADERSKVVGNIGFSVTF
jgi:hypothetical protein